MSDYRRLISYMYEYEGKEKGKNVGFVKLEAKNGQCRLNLSVKKVYAGGNAIGVYLLGKHAGETFLGNIFIRGGNGEFRAIVDASDVEGSGNSLEDYYGLTVHDVKSSWRAYTTIWEDAVLPETENDLAGCVPAQEILPGSERSDPSEVVSNAMREIEEEFQGEFENEFEKEESVTHAAEAGSEFQEIVSEPSRADPVKESQDQENQVQNQEDQIQEQVQQEDQTQKENEIFPMRSPELENPEVLRYLQDTEETAADPEKLWQELRKSYPKIQPFEYENGCEILTIRPQDIGRLPRESWIYGNNSFLLHGYYNFRYIILFRLGSKDGNPRYMIGVPGHYYSSEKYMASMFGFPNFVLSKKQPPNDGRFGYWYTDIKIR